MIISNASPIIYLSKIGQLKLLKNIFKFVIIPYEVYEETVVKGKEKGFQDALFIENAIREGWLKIKKIKIKKELIKFAPELELGEIAVMELAKKLKPKMLLIDDATARTIAESFGFNVKGTIYVILKAFKQRLINRKEAFTLISKLATAGFRISQEFYLQVIKKLEK